MKAANAASITFDQIKDQPKLEKIKSKVMEIYGLKMKKLIDSKQLRDAFLIQF